MQVRRTKTQGNVSYMPKFKLKIVEFHLKLLNMTILWGALEAAERCA